MSPRRLTTRPKTQKACGKAVSMVVTSMLLKKTAISACECQYSLSWLGSSPLSSSSHRNAARSSSEISVLAEVER